MVGIRSSHPQSIASDTISTKHDYRDSHLFNNRLGCPAHQGCQTGGQWSVKEKQMHINALELLAVSLALKTFAKDKSHVLVLIRMDNISAKAYINHLGGTHSHQLNSIAVQLWKWCLDRHISLTADHLPGKNYQVANGESRKVKDRCNWMIHPELVAWKHQEMGPLDVDLFASHLTYQLLRFYSWRQNPPMEATDAFTQDWSQFHGYVNLPWCLLLWTLYKIQRKKAKVLLIAPVWRTQPWYPILLQLLCSIPRLLSMDWDKGIVVSPTQKDFIMPTGVPQLSAWPLSGNNVDQEDFQKQLQGYSQLPGGTKNLQLWLSLQMLG